MDEASVNADNNITPSFIKNGKLSKLPACDTCFENLKRAHKFLLEHKTLPLNSSSSSSSENSSNTFSSTSNSGRDNSWSKAVQMLKPLSFKRCDVGRIPKSLIKLNSCERTAIAPFVAFTKIKQLRSSKHLPGSAQSSTSGFKFSIPSKAIARKDFFIPLSHDEFIKSHRKKLPRDDVAVRN